MMNQFHNRRWKQIVFFCFLCLFLRSFGGIPLPEKAFAQAGRESEFPLAMHRSMTEMQHAMEAAPMTGEPDRDFAAMMIPHHQGALDMARAELMYGHDPVLRRLAQEIIVDQQSEIDVMKLWLSKHPSKAGPVPKK